MNISEGPREVSAVIFQVVANTVLQWILIQEVKSVASRKKKRKQNESQERSEVIKENEAAFSASNGGIWVASCLLLSASPIAVKFIAYQLKGVDATIENYFVDILLLASSVVGSVFFLQSVENCKYYKLWSGLLLVVAMVLCGIHGMMIDCEISGFNSFSTLTMSKVFIGLIILIVILTIIGFGLGGKIENDKA